MPPDLHGLLDPAYTAVLTSECQEGIIGAASRVRALAEAVQAGGMVGRIAALLDRARARRIPVVHCIVTTRPDRGGSSANCPLLAFARAGKGGGLLPGSPEARLLPALGPAEDDYVVARLHGISPFHGTELDAILRNLGVRTVVATGVSLNVALLGLTIEAVNRGYQVVLPLDATAGTPPAYVELLVEHTLRLLATVTTTAAVVSAWQEAGTEDARPG
jgi:nicotinamidase-related amidase